MPDLEHMDYLRDVTEKDVYELQEKEKSYGGSWKKRGGVGAFMMLARKWDRIEIQVQHHNYNIFKAIEEDPRTGTEYENVLDDIRDLRRYLILIEAELVAQGHFDANK